MRATKRRSDAATKRSGAAPGRAIRSSLLRVAPSLLVLALSASALGQTLEERLDEDEFLRGLVELDVPEVLDHYIETHRPGDSARLAQLRVAREARLMRAARPGSDEREEALRRVLELRAEQIRLHPDHAHRALWMADQASDLLLEMLPIRASGLSTLFGVPSPDQRERAEHVAGRMNALMSQAELEIERTIHDIETSPGYRDDDELRRRRRRLVRDERDRRIPFLRGVAACLFAEIGARSDGERAEHHAIAVQMLEPLTSSLSGSPARRAALYCGLAMVRRGDYDAAERLLTGIPNDTEATSPDKFAARATLSLLRAGRDGPAAGLAAIEAVTPHYAGADELFYRVLLADQRYLLRTGMTRGARTSARDHPVNVYVELLERERDVPRETIRAIVLERIADAVETTNDLRELPAIATIARAERLAREDRGPEAIMLYEQALTRDDLDAADRASALFGLGRSLHAMNRPGAAARRFLQVAVEHAGDWQADRAVELAASILHGLRRRHPDDDRVRTAFDQCLEALFRAYRHLPTIGHWHYVAGEAALAAGDPEGAAAHFARIGPEDPEYLDAVFMGVNLRRAATMAGDATDARRAHETLIDAAQRAQEIIEQALPGADADRRHDLEYYVAHLRVFRAQSLLAIDEPARAVDVLIGIERQPGVDGASLAAALRVRIDAYHDTGRAGDARGEILRFMAAAPDQSGAVLDSMLDLTLRDVETLLAQGRDDEAREWAREEGVPLASLLREWLASHATPPDVRDRYLTQIATMDCLGGRFEEALAIFNRLAAAHPDTVEILFGRAECLYGLGGDGLADAMAIYKRLAAGGPGIGAAYYWQSQLRMLLVLDRVGRNTDQIVPRINRLRTGDEDLGGPRFRRQFERLANKHS